MQAGQLDRRITLEKKTSAAPGKFGAPADSWGLLAVVWAKVQYGGDEGTQGGGEAVVAGRNYAKQQATITIRYRDDIFVSPSLRIRYDGRIFNIRDVNTVGRRDKMVILADCDNVGNTSGA